MALRMIASGLVEGPLLISITKLLHAVELPILLVAIFKYNSSEFPTNVSPPPFIWVDLPAPAPSLVPYCPRWQALAMEIWLRPILSDHGHHGVQHHVYFHFPFALN